MAGRDPPLFRIRSNAPSEYVDAQARLTRVPRATVLGDYVNF